MKELEILVGGKPVRQIGHEGRTYIIAHPGTKYQIRVKNNAYARVMATVSVDGLSVLDGEKAEEDSRGYLINGCSSYTIEGWRISDDKVRAFEFADKDQSYAAKSECGDPTNCGVIGLVLWSEKIKPIRVTKHVHHYYPQPDPWMKPRIYEWPDTAWALNSNPATILRSLTTGGSGTQQCALNSCSTSSFNSGQLSYTSNVHIGSKVADFDMGTKFSDHEIDSQVRTVDFETGSVVGRYEVYYASKGQLRDMGVPVDKANGVALPQAFAGYCKPPRK